MSMTKPFTHIGVIEDGVLKKQRKVLLRQTKHCWVASGGRRYLITTGHPPGLITFQKDVVRIRLLLDTVREIKK